LLKKCGKPSHQVLVDVKQKTPFLTGFSTHLFGRVVRKNQDLLAGKRRTLHEGSMLDIAQQLRDEISPELLEKHILIHRVPSPAADTPSSDWDA